MDLSELDRLAYDGAELPLKREAQIRVTEHYGWTIQEFREHFGRNYL